MSVGTVLNGETECTVKLCVICRFLINLREQETTDTALKACIDCCRPICTDCAQFVDTLPLFCSINCEKKNADDQVKSEE